MVVEQAAMQFGDLEFALGRPPTIWGARVVFLMYSKSRSMPTVNQLIFLFQSRVTCVSTCVPFDSVCVRSQPLTNLVRRHSPETNTI